MKNLDLKLKEDVEIRTNLVRDEHLFSIEVEEFNEIVKPFEKRLNIVFKNLIKKNKIVPEEGELIEWLIVIPEEREKKLV